VTSSANHWEFRVNEISPCHYRLYAERNSGNIISFDSKNIDLQRLYLEAFNLEVSLGTLPSRALYLIIASAKKKCFCEYSDEAFGSWQIYHQETGEKYIYDGKDFTLSYSKPINKISWNCYFRNKSDISNEILANI